MDLTRGELGEYFLNLGEKEYRATQIIKWMHQRGVSDISKMTDLSKELRERLSHECEIRAPEVIGTQKMAQENGWLVLEKAI